MESIEEVKTLIGKAKRVCVLTGAGVSAESGIATFRGYSEEAGESLWSQYDPQQLASIEGFLREPEMVWRWYQWRRQVNQDKQPNPAHTAIANWQKAAKNSGQQEVSLITQNVDGLHQKAGSDPDQFSVIEIHGNIWQNHCLGCDKPYLEDVTGIQTVPTCQSCGGQIRPSVVWFGEALDETKWQVAETAAYCCDLFLSIGTSSQVYPAAGLMMLAKSQGAKVVEVNPEPTQSRVVDYQIRGKAGEILPKLIDY
ncbi:NAD-dependent deacylase [Kangiella sp. TOML190]|uniref:SIR2 family NAD-dependent protein deacylase n=1 Tax=Kangiella sp. TOML190 TaxID=2931351 RepID=UPI002041BE87|nr:NAD-dependent deacylase [Kangiella sp. TOML190]